MCSSAFNKKIVSKKDSKKTTKKIKKESRQELAKKRSDAISSAKDACFKWFDSLAFVNFGHPYYGDYYEENHIIKSFGTIFNVVIEHDFIDREMIYDFLKEYVAVNLERYQTIPKKKMIQLFSKYNNDWHAFFVNEKKNKLEFRENVDIELLIRRISPTEDIREEMLMIYSKYILANTVEKDDDSKPQKIKKKLVDRKKVAELFNLYSDDWKILFKDVKPKKLEFRDDVSENELLMLMKQISPTKEIYEELFSFYKKSLYQDNLSRINIYGLKLLDFIEVFKNIKKYFAEKYAKKDLEFSVGDIDYASSVENLPSYLVTMSFNKLIDSVIFIINEDESVVDNFKAAYKVELYKFKNKFLKEIGLIK